MAKNNRYCDNLSRSLSRSREKESEVQLSVRDLKGRRCGMVLAVAAVMVHAKGIADCGLLLL